jgi:hypothetical protein
VREEFQLRSPANRDPELDLDESLSPAAYLNEHVPSLVEKDIILSAGIQKVQTFARVFALLAARTGTLLNASSVSQESGVQPSTILDWAGTLERTHLVHRLQPWHSNLSKRVLKTPKLCFLDIGPAARLQGWSARAPLLRSPQAGPLFETLVLSEIMKTRDHFLKDWQVFSWRTRKRRKSTTSCATPPGRPSPWRRSSQPNPSHPWSSPPAFGGSSRRSIRPPWWHSAARKEWSPTTVSSCQSFAWLPISSRGSEAI